MQALKLCLSKSHEVADGVSVWEWSGSALDEGAEASKWFSNYIGKPSRLVRFNDGRSIQAIIISINYYQVTNDWKMVYSGFENK